MLSGSEHNAFQNYLQGGAISAAVRRKIIYGRLMQEYDWRQLRLAHLPENSEKRLAKFMKSRVKDPSTIGPTKFSGQTINASQRLTLFNREKFACECKVFVSTVW